MTTLSSSGTLRHVTNLPLRIRIGHHGGHGFFHFGHPFLHGLLWLTVIVLIMIVVAIALIVRRFTTRRRYRRPF